MSGEPGRSFVLSDRCPLPAKNSMAAEVPVTSSMFRGGDPSGVHWLQDVGIGSGNRGAYNATEWEMVRLAVTGDLHIRVGDLGQIAPGLGSATSGVDALLIAGDITEHGRIAEANLACGVLDDIDVPIIAVLGNHDLRSLRRLAFRQVLAAAGVTVLDGASLILVGDDGFRVGIVGISGCGGGFWPAAIPDALPARAWNALAVRQRREATKLDEALANLDADVRIVLMHFAPTASTLGNEPGAKYWMLGNGELGRVIDRHQVDLVLHGHAHLGNQIGFTTGGTPVRNVAYPVNAGVVYLSIERAGIVESERLGQTLAGLSA
jgi:Icc-related predicted phosphoesterase